MVMLFTGVIIMSIQNLARCVVMSTTKQPIPDHHDTFSQTLSTKKISRPVRYSRLFSLLIFFALFSIMLNTLY